MSKTNKKQNRNILEIRKIKTKNGEKAVVQFSKGVTILVDGQELDLGKYGSIFIKTKKELEADLDFYLENDYIDEKQHEDRMARLEEKNVTGAVSAPVK